MNRDVGCDCTGLSRSSCCVSLHVGNGNDPKCQARSLSVMESVGEVSSVGAHKDACAKETKREPSGWCPLLYVPVYVLQGARMVNGELESVF